MKIIEIQKNIEEAIGYVSIEAICEDGSRNCHKNNQISSIDKLKSENKGNINIDEYTPIPLNALLLIIIEIYLIQK